MRFCTHYSVQIRNRQHFDRQLITLLPTSISLRNFLFPQKYLVGRCNTCRFKGPSKVYFACPQLVSKVPISERLGVALSFSCRELEYLKNSENVFFQKYWEISKYFQNFPKYWGKSFVFLLHFVFLYSRSA